VPQLLVNKKAHFDYQIIEEFRAGMALSGGMVKLIRSKKVVLNGKFVVFQKGVLQILGLGNEEISHNVPLLLAKKEIKEIVKSLQVAGLTCVILNIHTHKRWLKAQIAVVKGKKNYDKRETIKERDLERESRRNMN